MFSQTPSLQSVINQLVVEQHLPPEAPATIAEALAGPEKRATPWYIQALIGLSGWVAAFFFIGFLVIIELVTTETEALIAGLIFCAGAVGLRWATRHSIFTGQLTLALSLAGQGLFITGLWQVVDNVTLTLLITMLFEGLLLVLYPDKLHRFLSTLVMAGAALYLFVDLEIATLTHAVIILLLVGTVLIWHRESWFLTGPLADFYRPVGYGLPLATFGFLVLSLSDETGIDTWWLSAIGLLLILLYLEYHIFNEQGFAWSHPTVLAVMAISLLLLGPAWYTPGILAALIGLLLGFQRGNSLLLGLALAFLAVFLIGYYYNLNLTLLTKSFILMGTGLILLALRLGLPRLFTLEEAI
jgi:hypothetical protein